MKISILDLTKTISNILSSLNVPNEHIDIVSDSIIYAHRKEVHTHGVNRLPIYVRKINENLLNINSRYLISKLSPNIISMDCDHGFGQVAAYYAIQNSIKIGKKNGIAMCTIKNSNNFGIAGYYSEIAANQGMISMIFSNSAPAIAPYGGIKPLFGTNPIAFGFPSFNENPPIILDMACSVVSRGRIRLAKKNNQDIPLGWALDKYGSPTNNPLEALEGSMIPIGGYKGSGLAMIVDLFAGLLSNSAFGGDVKPLNHPTQFSMNGHLLLVIDPKFFMNVDVYINKLDYFIKNVKNSGDFGKVRLPGDGGIKLFERNKYFVDIDNVIIDEIRALCSDFGVACKL